ncbi:MAG TPA: ATP-binding protein [Methylomirabilota bacterium]|nr:ATP-binding protein [Methylomirabilota bacterium]
MGVVRAVNGARETWRLLWARPLGRALVVVFGALAAVYLFQLGPEYWRGRLTAHLDRLVMPFLIVLFVLRTRHVAGREERRFWRLLILALVAWLGGSALFFASTVTEMPRWVDLAVDVGYILLYLFMAVAADQQPQMPDGWSERDVLYPFTMISATVFIAVMFGYFVVVPWAMNPSENLQYFASFNLYVTLDLLLTLRFALLFRASRSERWRRCFGLLAVVFATLAVGDLLEGLSFAGSVEMVTGARVDGIWLIPPFCLATAALTCTRGAARPDDADEATDGRVQSLLPVYAFALPLVHLGMYLLDYLDQSARDAREAIVFGGLVVFAILSLVQQTRLERAVASLRSDLMVRALDDRMRQSQRLESVGRLAAGVAHDLNNLLTVIKSYAELAVLRLTPSDTATRGRLVEIDRAADRAADLIRQLLAFGRQQVLKPEVVHVNDQVRGLEGMLSRILGDDVELVVDLDPESGFTRVDPGLLEQVVVNLAVNARDAMPRGGRLTITTRRSRRPVGDGGHADTVELAVSDTGVGIDPEIRDRIFEPYFTTKGMETGTGLGLATVHGIVEQSGGTIEVASETDRGATFTVNLPRTSDRPAAAETPATRPSRPVAGETVLLTEDEATIRTPIAEYLEGLGLEVLQAADGVDALAVAAHHPGPIHLLVTDLVMPRMSGPDLAHRLLAERPGIKIVYVSGYTPDAVHAYGASAEDGDVVFLQKPFLLEDLGATIRATLES